MSAPNGHRIAAWSLVLLLIALSVPVPARSTTTVQTLRVATALATPSNGPATPGGDARSGITVEGDHDAVNEEAAPRPAATVNEEAAPRPAATVNEEAAPRPAATVDAETAAVGAEALGQAAAETAIEPGSVNRTSLRVRATYAVRARLGWASRAFNGSVVITATNVSGRGIDRLELNTVMARLGRLRLGEVTVDGSPVRASVDDQTIMVPLGGILPDGATVVVRVPWRATLRSSVSGSSWLFARVNGIADLYRWIPWISRRTPFDRPNHGDPFVTPVSPRVVVRIRSSVPLRFAGTGHRTAISDDRRTQVFAAANVRDVALAAARDYRTLRATVGGTSVRVSYRRGAPGSAMLAAAKRALRRLERRLGPYPYGTLRVVQSAGGYGMEGPGVAWIPTGVGSGNLTYLVAHEIAHQWFYALVGNDQAREPFADEAAADFAARFVLDLRRGSRCPTDRLDRTIYHYSSACYYETVYIQGGNLLDRARRRMGSGVFWPALRGYITDHRFGLVHTRTLLDALDGATPLDMASWWRARFPRLY